MLTAILALTIFALACFDARLTVRRINKYGVSVENNGGIKYLSTLSGPELATLVGVVIPNVFIVSLCFVFGWKTFLAGLLGFKLRYFYNQCLSIRFEKEAKKLKNKINNSRRD
jgi:hypothetical protein